MCQFVFTFTSCLLFTGGKFTLYQPINLYRKFTADQIFTGREILTSQCALITTSEGVVVDMVKIVDAGDDIETFTGLLTPGFINAHCHVELSHLKGFINSGTGLVEFVQQVMGKRNSFNEVKLNAMETAVLEMYNGGVQAVGDICNTTDTIVLKQKSKLHWHNFIEVSGFTDATAHNRLTDIKKVYDEFYAHQLLKTTLSPHSPYSVSKTLFRELNNETDKQLITIHNQECAAENDLYQNKSGGFLDLYKNLKIDITAFEPTRKTSLQSWLPYFNNKQPIILVHNTFLSQADIDFSKQQLNTDGHLTSPSIAQLYFCICANANKYIEQKLPPIDLLLKNNCNIVIGTDSYASNWQLDILDEIRTIQKEPSFTIPLTKILQWATINGARALQMDDVMGSFEKGKKPGVVLIVGINNSNITALSSSRRIL
jgi:cytosine/adenosine deaminase-related metal-dependent hydrolase